MHQLTQQLAEDLRRQRFAAPAQQGPAQRLLMLRRATRRAERQAQQLRAQLEA